MGYKEPKYVILNGTAIKETDAVFPAVSSANYYGTGCFETMKAESGQIFRFDEHIKRLNNGLIYLGAEPYNFVEKSHIKDEIEELVSLNHLSEKDAKIRYQVGLHERGGYGKPDSLKLMTLATADAITLSQGAQSLVRVQTRVIPSECKPAHFKSSNMLHYRKAFREAKKVGAYDGLMLTTDGFVAETSISNIFWKKGNDIFTPSSECDILPGIMRDTIIEILESDVRFKMSEGKYLPSVLTNADAIWITNSVLEIQEINRVDDHTVNRDIEFIKELRELLDAVKQRDYADA